MTIAVDLGRKAAKQTKQTKTLRLRTKNRHVAAYLMSDYVYAFNMGESFQD